MYNSQNEKVGRESIPRDISPLEAELIVLSVKHAAPPTEPQAQGKFNNLQNRGLAFVPLVLPPFDTGTAEKTDANAN